MSIEKPSQELSVEESLSRTFHLYSRNFVTFFTPILIVTLLIGAFQTFISYYGFTLPPLATGATTQEILDWLSTFVVKVLLLGATLGVLS